MSILCIGSVNIDHAYRVTALPGPGETVLDKGYLRGLGGKGANMSLAARAAGAVVAHAGAIGEDGLWCRDHLADKGIAVGDLVVVEAATGHGLIVVDDAAENAIVVHSGANRRLTIDQIERSIGRQSGADWLLLQNETNLVAEAAAAGRAAGLKVAYAAAPFDAAAATDVLDHADLLVVNEVEAEQLSRHLGRSLGDIGLSQVLVTLGARGARLMRRDEAVIETPAFKVDPVDTTGAGDTFTGFFLAGIDQGDRPEAALRRAAAAAALQITRPGAGEVIPTKAEVDGFLKNREPRAPPSS